MLSCCFSDFSVGLGAFVLRLSQISSFSSQNTFIKYDPLTPVMIDDAKNGCDR